MRGARVRIGGLTFEGGEGDEGFFLDLDDGLAGWDDSVEVREDRAELQLAHGDHDLPVYRGARIVTLNGDCVTSSPTMQQHYSQRLGGVLARGGTGRLTVEHESVTTWADVRLTGSGPKFAIRKWGELARYQIQFKASNPRKYGATRTFTTTGGTVQVSHRGSFHSDPLCTIQGTFPNGYSIEAGGHTFIVTEPLAAGTRTIDMRTGMLFNGTTRVQGGIAAADTFSIPGGALAAVTFNTLGGSGSLRLDLLDTYM